jgi:hypothetical protein
MLFHMHLDALAWTDAHFVQAARKHGIADDDMFHAVRNPIAQSQLDGDLTMRAAPPAMATYPRSACSASTPTIP